VFQRTRFLPGGACTRSDAGIDRRLKKVESNKTWSAGVCRLIGREVKGSRTGRNSVPKPDSHAYR
jgi:hypothetical protein